MAIRLEVLSHKVNGEGVGGRRAAQFAGTHRRTSGDELEQSSNSRAVSGIEQGGFFLRKKPLSINGLPLQQFENCYSGSRHKPEVALGFGYVFEDLGFEVFG